MKLIETSKVYNNSRAVITTIPILIRKTMNIEKGDHLEWHVDTKTEELRIKVKKNE